QFDVHRKVSARGRVIDAETGRPLHGMPVLGEIPNRLRTGAQPQPNEKWAYTGWGESDENGAYTVSLAAGRARVSFRGDKYVAVDDSLEFDVAADGSSVIPDMIVRPIPKVSGVVLDADGKPAAKTVVRFRDKLQWMEPLVTDAEGRFELQPEDIPIDDETQQR